MNRLRLVPLLLLLLLLSPCRPAQAVTAGSPAPEFELPGLDGAKVRLADYKGRLVLLKLATTWCPSCRQQSQELHELADLLKQHEVVVLEIFLQDSAAMVRDYFQGIGPRLPGSVALIDDDQVRRRYNVYTIPRVLLLDRQLNVLRDGGLWSTRDIKAALDEAAKQPAK